MSASDGRRRRRVRLFASAGVSGLRRGGLFAEGTGALGDESFLRGVYVAEGVDCGLQYHPRRELPQRELRLDAIEIRHDAPLFIERADSETRNNTDCPVDLQSDAPSFWRTFSPLASDGCR